MAGSSAWEIMLARSRVPQAVPPLQEVVVPQAALVRQALANDVLWVVGPPKVGKTVFAHYIGYLRALARKDIPLADRMAIFEGATGVARGLEGLLEGPDKPLAVLLLENPLGTDDGQLAGQVAALLERLRRERPNTPVVATSRHHPFLQARKVLPAQFACHTKMSLSEWYRPKDLFAWYKDSTPGLTLDLAEELACPALVVQFRNHGVKPTPGRRVETRRKFGEASDEITLDKVAMLSHWPELRELAMLLLLQEHAFALPTVDDISSLLGQPVGTIDHLGLVATTFTFDGSQRLRFEHSTTRDAADLLLRQELTEGMPRLRPLLDQTAASWPRRAFELWQAERRACDGQWDDLKATPSHVLSDVAGQLISHAKANEHALNIVSGLDMDPWTAQDIGYSLANGWQLPAPVASRRLATRLSGDRPARGAYALLEALLYVRNGEVSDLWSTVEREYTALVDDGPPWDVEPLRTLLLGVDAMAWRPPPADRTTSWFRAFLAKLSPDDDAWALVRFLRGYHPDGLHSYLASQSAELASAVERDKGTHWSPEQGVLGRWLVQWHFVHQSRARAQFAHQPWIAQEYLVRTFHLTTVDEDRDRDAAELVRSVAGAPGSQEGWGYFLMENLRAVSPATVGPETRQAGKDALRAANPHDQGVLAAVLTYEPEPALAELVAGHYAEEAAREVLFDALYRGLIIDGTRLTEPRFSHRRELAAVHDACGIVWKGLAGAILDSPFFDAAGRLNIETFVQHLERAVAAVDLGANPPLQQRVDEVLERSRAGDLRKAEDAAVIWSASRSARPKSSSPGAEVLDAVAKGIVDSLRRA